MYARSGFGDLSLSLVFQKTSGSGDIGFSKVGESWSIRITGPSNQPVFVRGGKNGAMDTNQMGMTDASGNFSLSGTFTADQVGSWSERWWIGNELTGNLSAFTFNVAAATPATQPPATNPPPNSGAFIPPSVINQITDSSGLDIAGYHVPWWGLAAAAGFIGLFAFGGRR